MESTSLCNYLFYIELNITILKREGERKPTLGFDDVFVRRHHREGYDKKLVESIADSIIQ